MKILSTLVLVICIGQVSAQISGNTPVASGSQHTYSYNQTTLVSPSWQANGGSINSQWQSGLTYYVTVTWGDYAATGNLVLLNGQTAVASKQIGIIPPAPTPQAGTLANSYAFNANWTALSSATSYTVEYSLYGSFPSPGATTVQNSSTSTAEVGSLTPNTLYYWRVKASNANGTGPVSSSMQTRTAPAPPTIVSGTITQTSFYADWLSSSGATSYELSVATDWFQTFLTGYNPKPIPTGTAFLVDNLSPGTTYNWRVRAISAAGLSNTSVQTIKTIPAMPVNVQLSSPTSEGFTATWDACFGASGYEVDVATSSTFLSSTILTAYKDLAVTTNSINVTSIPGGKTYYFRVRAKNESGASAKTAGTSILIKPSSPTLVSYPATNNSMTVTWTASTGASSYTIQLFGGSSFQNLLHTENLSATSFQFTSLGANTFYRFKVTATNAAGSSTATQMDTKTATNAPVTAGYTYSSPTLTGFTANWQGVTGATKYKVEVSVTDTFNPVFKSSWVSAPGTLGEFTGLSSDTKYYYRVTADNDYNLSPPSDHVTAYTVPAPPALQAASDLTMTSFRAKWQYESTATKYFVDILNASLATIHSNVMTTTNYLDVTTLLQSGAVYYYQVRTENPAGLSITSGRQQVSTLTAEPTATSASPINATNFTATWVPHPNASSYQLDVSTDPNFSTFLSGFNSLSIPASANTHLIGAQSPLTPNIWYYYRLRTVNGSGTPSANSNRIDVLTKAAAPVAAAATSVTNTSFVANFTPTTGSVTSDYAIEVTESGVPGSTFSVNATSSPATVNAPAGKIYDYVVKTRNGSGLSAPSNSVSVTMPPGAPTQLGSSLVTVSGFTASWSPAPLASTYRLDVSEQQDFSTLLTAYNNVTVNSNITSVSGLDSDRTYYWRVRAVNSVGTSVNSLPAEVITVDVLATVDANFIKTTTFQVSGFSSVPSTGLDPEDAAVSYQFFDGLGRAHQAVGNKASPTKKDIISKTTYDSYGRPLRSYLPYSATGNGSLPSTSLTDQTAFYATSLAYNGKVKSDDAPYSESLYEASPLSRVIQQGAPGAAWQPNAADPQLARTIKYEMAPNVDGNTTEGEERIKIWQIDQVTINTKTEFILSSTSNYPTGSLIVKIVYDEHHRQIREYTDKLGNVILKKVQYTAGSPSTLNDNDWTLTYYVYDDFGRLRFVMQPKFLSRLSVYAALATSTDKKNMLDSLSFEYRYDQRSRMVYKRVPGAAYVDMVYDRWDRLVLSQDGAQRAEGNWSFTKYDVFNRPIITGVYSNSNTASEMVTAVASTTNDRFETTSTNSIGYSYGETYPKTVSSSDINTVTYYDDHTFIQRMGLPTTYNALIPSGFTQTAQSQNATLATGSRVRVLDVVPTEWLTTVTYYDKHSRVLQTVSTDILGNINRTTNEYKGLTGLVIKSLLQHGASTTCLTEFDYDHTGRVVNNWQTMDGGSKVLLANYRYNEIGQLVEKNIHSTDNGSTFLQNIDYRYNIRGWLTHINNDALSNDGAVNDDATDLFGMELRYDQNTSVNGTTAPAQFNGNISSASWATTNLIDPTQQKIYGFDYDALNRLTTARYATKTAGAWTGESNSYNEALTYDKNGNILTLQRNSVMNGVNVALGGTAGAIDNLSYKYKGNRLDVVNDAAASSYKPYGFKEATSLTTGEYAYDNSGNMTVDLNKQITAIEYNHLNLTKEVTLYNDHRVVYTYDATGQKLRKIVYDGSSDYDEVSRTTYVGPFHYEGETNVLSFMSNSEGRVVKNGTSWNYEYFHKDHLGNVRSVFGYQQVVDEYLATMETAHAEKEESQFGNVTQTRVTTTYNHTTASIETLAPDKACLLNGYANITGTTTPRSVALAKVLQVIGGDKVELEVFARQPGSVSSSTLITSLASAVTDAFGLTTGEAGYSALNSNVGTLAGSFSRNTGSAKAYLFYVLLDANYNYANQFGYAKVTSTARTGFERLYLEVTLPANFNGYLYTYVANESKVSTADVYFDDFSIVHKRNTSALQVVQVSDYYPFGLTSRSYQKESSISQDYQYSGKENQTQLGLGWLDYGARMYQADVGRWLVIDPLSGSMEAASPYNFALNNPTTLVDILGLAPVYNWELKRYEENGKEASWDDVQKAYKIGDDSKKAKNILVMGNDLSDDPGGAMASMLTAAMENGNISVMRVKDTEDAANQIEALMGSDKELGSLIIGSHGSYNRASFSIGTSNYRVGKIKKDNNLDRISKFIGENSQIIIHACHAGNPQNGGTELLTELAVKMKTTVFGNQSWSVSGPNMFGGSILGLVPYYQQTDKLPSDSCKGGPCSTYSSSERGRAFESAGAWTKVSYSSGQTKVTTVNNVQYTSSGGISYGGNN
jgi:RHS repeat-associated protein